MSSITGSVNGVANPGFSYDANGNLLYGAGRSYAWTSYDRPQQITLGSGVSLATDTFLHSPEHQRIRQIRAKGSPAVTDSTVYYAGAIEREVRAGGATVTKTYLPQNLGVIQDTQSGSMAVVTAVSTFHHDHLGSVVALSDEAANVVERLSYDAWGLRRNLDGSDDTGAPPNQIRDSIDNKGYTGHEHLDDVRLVHMNGRVYDPVVGRFTSADPMVSDTEASQGRNRYSYVLNHPLAFTDPTGLREDNVYGETANSGAGGACSIALTGCTVYEFGDGDFSVAADTSKRSSIWERIKAFFSGRDLPLAPADKAVEQYQQCKDRACVVESRALMLKLLLEMRHAKATVVEMQDLSVQITHASLRLGDYEAAAESMKLVAAAAIALGIQSGSGKIAAKGAAGETRFINGVTVVDKKTGNVLRGTVDLKPTLDRISVGKSFPHKNDGSVFANKEGLLPSQPAGYYKEFVHPTPGVSGPGPQRVVTGQGGEIFYTPDHYGTFIRVNP